MSSTQCAPLVRRAFQPPPDLGRVHDADLKKRIKDKLLYMAREVLKAGKAATAKQSALEEGDNDGEEDADEDGEDEENEDPRCEPPRLEA